MLLYVATMLLYVAPLVLLLVKVELLHQALVLALMLLLALAQLPCVHSYAQHAIASMHHINVPRALRGPLHS